MSGYIEKEWQEFLEQTHAEFLPSSLQKAMKLGFYGGVIGSISILKNQADNGNLTEEQGREFMSSLFAEVGSFFDSDDDEDDDEDDEDKPDDQPTQ